MTYIQRSIALEEARNNSDRDAFISDLATSSLFGEVSDADLPALVHTLGRIWDAQWMSIRDLRGLTGLSQAKFGVRFGIPTRTIENWEREISPPPSYVRLMIAEILGVLPPVD